MKNNNSNEILQETLTEKQKSQISYALYSTGYINNVRDMETLFFNYSDTLAKLIQSLPNESDSQDQKQLIELIQESVSTFFPSSDNTNSISLLQGEAVQNNKGINVLSNADALQLTESQILQYMNDVIGDMQEYHKAGIVLMNFADHVIIKNGQATITIPHAPTKSLANTPILNIFDIHGRFFNTNILRDEVNTVFRLMKQICEKAPWIKDSVTKLQRDVESIINTASLNKVEDRVNLLNSVYNMMHNATKELANRHNVQNALDMNSLRQCMQEAINNYQRSVCFFDSAGKNAKLNILNELLTQMQNFSEPNSELIKQFINITCYDRKSGMFSYSTKSVQKLLSALQKANPYIQDIVTHILSGSADPVQRSQSNNGNRDFLPMLKSYVTLMNQQELAVKDKAHNTQLQSDHWKDKIESKKINLNQEKRTI